ncbi:E3 ubiquitin protein ligase COP1-like protein [Tanacetum coccineum]
MVMSVDNSSDKVASKMKAVASWKLLRWNQICQISESYSRIVLQFQNKFQGCDVSVKELDVVLVLLAEKKRKMEQEEAESYQLLKGHVFRQSSVRGLIDADYLGSSHPQYSLLGLNGCGKSTLLSCCYSHKNNYGGNERLCYKAVYYEDSLQKDSLQAYHEAILLSQQTYLSNSQSKNLNMLAPLKKQAILTIRIQNKQKLLAKQNYPVSSALVVLVSTNRVL